jgi:hypothetical protein
VNTVHDRSVFIDLDRSDWGDMSTINHSLSTLSQGEGAPREKFTPSPNRLLHPLQSNYREKNEDNTPGSCAPLRASISEQQPHPSSSKVHVQGPETLSAHIVSKSPPSSPLLSSSSPLLSLQKPRRLLRKYDPYSDLSTLERDVILCIKTAAMQHAKDSIYPPVGQLQRRRNPTWEGLHLSVIIAVMSAQRPDLSPEELQLVTSGSAHKEMLMSSMFQ